MGNLAKFWIAVGGTIVTGLQSVYPSTHHWIPAVSAAITAILVYLVPNAQNSDGQGKAQTPKQ